MVIIRKRRFVKSEAIDSVEPEPAATTAAASASASAANGRRSNATEWTKYIPTMGAIHQAINDIFVVTVVPECFIVLWLTGLIALNTLQVCLLGCLVLFVVLPLLFKYSVTLQRGILFLTFITYPKNLNFSAPEQQGLFATRNFVVSHNDPDAEDADDQPPNTVSTAVSIGVWHVLPYYVVKRYAGQLNLTASDAHIVTESATPAHHLADHHAEPEPEFATIDATNIERFYERTLQEPSAEIVLYLHGNSNSRGAPHRIEMYQLMRRLGYHVITLDYRGYGDSVGAAPTEAGVVRDAIAVYSYIRQRTHAPVYVWGHSLGTGIATHMMSLLARRNVPAPLAVVLESPFNNMDAEIRSHPMSRLFRNLPWFDYTIARPLYSNHLRFESDEHIAEFRQPVMILHAEDDLVIPFELGYKLYRSALDARGKTWGPVEFHRFGSENGFGHKYICRSIELPPMITAFFDSYRNTKY